MAKEKEEKTQENEEKPKKTVTTKKKSASKPKETETKKSSKPSKKDIEKKILELAEKGLTAEKMGLELKKDFGKIEKKQITKILKENNKYQNPDLTNINNNLEILKKHIGKNKMDFTAKKSLEKRIAQLRKMKKIQEKKISS